MSGENFSGELPKTELTEDQVINREVMYGLSEKYSGVFGTLYNTQWLSDTKEEKSAEFNYFYVNEIFPKTFGLKGVIVLSDYGITTIRRPDSVDGWNNDYVGSYAIGTIIDQCTEVDTTINMRAPVVDHSINKTSLFEVNHYPHGFDSRNLPPHLDCVYLGEMLKRANYNLVDVDGSENSERPQRTPPEDILSQMP